jgi:hypothetical protein
MTTRLNMPTGAGQNALYKAAEIVELPVDTQVMVCGSIETADEDQRWLDERKICIITTAPSADFEHIDWSPLMGRSVGLQVDPPIVDALASAIRPFASAIKVIDRPAGAAAEWTLALAQEGYRLKDHARDLPAGSSSPALGDAGADALGASGIEDQAPVASPTPADELVPIAHMPKPGPTKARTFAAFIAQHYSGPEAVLDAFLADAAAAAAEVDAELVGVPKLDGQWHYLPSKETGKREQRRSYNGDFVERKDGVALPRITFRTFKGGANTRTWSPGDALWRQYETWKAGAPPQHSEDKIAEYAARVERLRASAEALRANDEDSPMSADRARNLAQVRGDFQNGDPASVDHPYILRKAGKADDLRIVGWPKEVKGRRVLGWLMVPAYSGVGNFGEPMSIQFIGPGSREKLNAPGAPIKGCSFTIGKLEPGKKTYVAEGVGHIWTLNGVTGEPAVMTFGASGIEAATQNLIEVGSVPVIVPDRGKEAEAAGIAARLGCWYAPLPGDLPDGADVNDLHLQRGAAAVRAVLDAAIAPKAQTHVEPAEPPPNFDDDDEGAFDFLAGPAASPPKPTLPPFAFMRVGDLQLKPADWLIKGHLEADSLALLFSDPGVGKSFMGIGIACCVATGRPWHGNATKKGAVFYIAGEGHNGLKRRFSAWEIDQGVDLNDSPIYVSLVPAKLSVEESAQAVIEAVRTRASETGMQPRLIVVDTVARNFGPGDENSTQEMGEFIANLDRLKHEFKATVLLVHHSGHGDKSRARGSMALKGALDAEYRLERDDNGVIRFETTKMKEAEYPAPLSFRLKSIKLPLTDEDGNELTSAVMETVLHVPKEKPGKKAGGKNQKMALEILRQVDREHRARLEAVGRDPEEALVKEEYWRARLFEDGKLNRYAYRDVRKSLVVAGLIEFDSGGHVKATDV